VVTSINKISSCETPALSSKTNNIIFKKFGRFFDGGYNFTFYNAFSNIRDYKYKNHTNFYLTDEQLMTDVIESSNVVLKADGIQTTLSFGNTFLSFKNADKKALGEIGIYVTYDLYGNYGFSNIKDVNTNFTIELKPENKCEIYHTNNYKKYYLTVVNNNLNFYDKKLNAGDTIFDYIYSREKKSIFLFYNSLTAVNFVRKLNNQIVLTPITNVNKDTVYLNPVEIEKDIYIDFDTNDNFTIISYDESNKISEKELMKDIKNNFILHRENDDETGIIILKNQLAQEDLFTSGNNLISSSSIPYFMEEMRNYTSIFNDIDSVSDETLMLNYVFYNKAYEINPGQNFFMSPDSILPFLTLNINDSKITNCGAFPFPYPKYADKIYKKEDDIKYQDGQKYLCTWLSGSPLNKESVWVDRYYYPDLIEKAQALEGKNTFNFTYEDQIENLIKNNTSIQQSITAFGVFDKKSDLTFESNTEYIYERINVEKFEISENKVDECDVDFLNYFKLINEEGKFSVYFYFDGDSSNWVFESNRNKVDAGLRIIKNENDIKFEYRLFNTSNETFQIFESVSGFDRLKENFVGVAVDATNGVGYFFLNNNIVSIFNFSSYQYLNKQIIFGDFVKNLKIKNLNIYREYFEPELMAIQPILNGKKIIDKIFVTLPCGMRNSSDNVEYLQSICTNQSYKSNNFNVIVSDINFGEDIKREINQIIERDINKITPINTQINKIYYE
jgi:hypothetical protein